MDLEIYLCLFTEWFPVLKDSINKIIYWVSKWNFKKPPLKIWFWSASWSLNLVPALSSSFDCFGKLRIQSERLNGFKNIGVVQPKLLSILPECLGFWNIYDGERGRGEGGKEGWRERKWKHLNVGAKTYPIWKIPISLKFHVSSFLHVRTILKL